MAILTHLSPEEAGRIGREFGLDVRAARGLPAGSVNSNYELTLQDGTRAFLRVYEEQGPAAAAGEAALLDCLSAHGVRTPRPMPRRVAGAAPGPGGEFLSSLHGKAVAVFPWVEGEILCQSRITPAHTEQVGAALARVHLAGEDFRGASESRFGAAALAARLDGIPAAARSGEIGGAIQRLRMGLRTMVPSAPTALVHGDLFRDNVLWRSGAPEIAALLDFESASRGAPSFDLMVTVLAWCFGSALDGGLARALVGGYREVRPLSQVEAAALFRDGRYGAIRFAVTRITDFELRPRSSGVYKDYRRFLARLDALEALGEQGLKAFLGL